MPSAYILANVTVTNPAQYEDYRKFSSLAMQVHGAEVCIRGGAVTVLVCAVLLSLLRREPTTVRRVVFFHGLWAGVVGVAAWVVQRLNRQLYEAEG